jgi:hypothetical protein
LLSNGRGGIIVSFFLCCNSYLDHAVHMVLKYIRPV